MGRPGDGQRWPPTVWRRRRRRWRWYAVSDAGAHSPDRPCAHVVITCGHAAGCRSADSGADAGSAASSREWPTDARGGRGRTAGCACLSDHCHHCRHRHRRRCCWHRHAYCQSANCGAGYTAAHRLRPVRWTRTRRAVAGAVEHRNFTGATHHAAHDATATHVDACARAHATVQHTTAQRAATAAAASAGPTAAATARDTPCTHLHAALRLRADGWHRLRECSHGTRSQGYEARRLCERRCCCADVAPSAPPLREALLLC